MLNVTSTVNNKVCLSIAGLDPSGGAGIIADIKTFSAFGCFATAAITSLTYQNTLGVYGFAHQTADVVQKQLEPIFADFEIEAAKTGMLPDGEVIRFTALILKQNCVTRLVVDPVVRSTSGYDLIDDSALAVLIEEMFPISTVVTPNIPEAERITGLEIKSADDVIKAARDIRLLGAKNVLIKGGHFDDPSSSADYLFLGDELVVIAGERIATSSTHGTGCTLSSAIAANLALGLELKNAVEIAKRFVTEAIRSAPNLGHGHSPINQLIKT